LHATRHSTRKRDGLTTAGRRLFACTAMLSPAKAARIGRARWAVENRNHHPRDAALRENQTRCRTGHSAATLALSRLRAVLVALALPLFARPGLPRQKSTPTSPPPRFIGA
jgi:hypothetical protein